MARHRHDLAVVVVFLDDHVDLDWREAHLLCDLDTVQHFTHGKVDVVHAAEGRVVDGIQADGHAVQAGILERLRLACQQGTVGGECQVQRFALHRGQACQHFDQAFDVLAQQRLAACEADLLDAVLNEQARHALDLFERQ